MRLNSSSARQVSAHGLGGVDSAVADARRDVLAKLLEPVGVHDRILRAGGDDDEVAVPGLESLERREQLVALRPALGSLHPLLGIARREVERVDDRLLPLARLLGSRGRRRRG